MMAFANKKYAQQCWCKSIKHIISNYYSTISNWEVKCPLAIVSLESIQSIIQVTAPEIVHVSEAKDA